MKKVVILLVLLLCSSLVLGHGSTVSSLGLSETELVGSELPGFARSLFGNQKINLHVTLASGEEEIHGIVTEDGKITQVTSTDIEDKTLDVYTSENAILEISQASNTGQELQAALRDGRITYQAVGFMNRIRFSFVGVLTRIAGWFS